MVAGRIAEGQPGQMRKGQQQEPCIFTATESFCLETATATCDADNQDQELPVGLMVGLMGKGRTRALRKDRAAARKPWTAACRVLMGKRMGEREQE